MNSDVILKRLRCLCEWPEMSWFNPVHFLHCSFLFCVFWNGVTFGCCSSSMEWMFFPLLVDSRALFIFILHGLSGLILGSKRVVLLCRLRNRVLQYPCHGARLINSSLNDCEGCEGCVVAFATFHTIVILTTNSCSLSVERNWVLVFLLFKDLEAYFCWVFWAVEAQREWDLELAMFRFENAMSCRCTTQQCLRWAMNKGESKASTSVDWVFGSKLWQGVSVYESIFC